MTLTAAPAERTTSSDEVNLMGHGDVSVRDELPKTDIENPQDFGAVLGKKENLCCSDFSLRCRNGPQGEWTSPGTLGNQNHKLERCSFLSDQHACNFFP